MKPLTLQNYAEGQWVAGSGGMAELRSAVNGDVVALTSSQGLDFGAMAALRARAGRRRAVDAHIPRTRAHAEGARRSAHRAQG